MKKSLKTVVLALFALSFFGCKDSARVVKIGVFEPASGDNGAGGKQEILGIRYANLLSPVVTINGKEYTVELDIVDNESSTEVAPIAARELVKNAVSLVLGSYGSAVSIAGSDTFGKAGIPVIGVSCTNPQVTLGNEHYFRICFLDPFQGTVLASFAAENFRASRAYCLAKLGDDYSVGLCNYFMEAFKKLGGEVIYENFPEGTTDFSSYVANARSQHADVFFTPVSIEAAVHLIKEAAAQKLAIPIFAGDTWDSNVVLSAAKNTGIEIYVTTYFMEGSTEPNVVEFVNGFHQWLKDDPEALEYNGGNEELAAVTAMGFDAYYTALEALKNTKSLKSKDLLKAVSSVNYNGVSGPISFDKIGNADRNEAFVKKVDTKNGTWEFIAVQKIK